MPKTSQKDISLKLTGHRTAVDVRKHLYHTHPSKIKSGSSGSCGWGRRPTRLGSVPMDEAALSPLRPCERGHGRARGPRACFLRAAAAAASGWCRRAPTPTHLTPSRHAALVLSSSCCCTVNALTLESGRAPGGRDMVKSIGMNQFSLFTF